MIRALIMATVGLWSLSACASSDTSGVSAIQKSETTVAQSIIIRGRLSLRGSTPHSYLNIKDIDSGSSYKIENSKSFGLSSKQNQMVKIKAEIISEAVGPGLPSVIRVVKLII